MDQPSKKTPRIRVVTNLSPSNSLVASNPIIATSNSVIVSNLIVATATFKRSAWDTDNHNYWISETIQIAKVTASTNPDQLTNAVEQSQQAIVNLQSKPIVMID